MRLRLYALALSIAALAGLAAACVTNPATGRAQFLTIGREQEIAIGKEQHPLIKAQYGVYEDAPLQNWFEEVSARLAATSEMPNLPYTFTILDSEIVNAFALPGGPVYATRGLLAHANSEAELAGVMGHEIGHVVGRHGAEQLSRGQIVQGGLGLLGAVQPEAGWLQQILGAGAQLLLLRYSRSAEEEADELGIRYMTRAGYDPIELSSFMRVLDGLRQRSGSTLPTWLATHPDPGDRVTRTQALARPVRQKAAAEGRELLVGRQSYLERIEGLVYGADPRHGFSRGRVFHHPDLAFRFSVPEGWTIINERSFVAATDDASKPSGIFQLSLVPGDEASLSPSAFVERAQQESQGRVAFDGRPTTINGLSAWLGIVRVPVQGGQRSVLAAWVSKEGRLYQMTGDWARDAEAAMRPLLEESLRSFRTETDREVLGVEPVRVDLVPLPAGQSMERLCRRLDDLGESCETVAFINQLDRGETVAERRLVKIPERRHPLYP